MMTQTDLFEPAGEIVDYSADKHESAAKTTNTSPIAVPCGFMDRHNNRCQRLGKWPVMADGKQMVCRGRPILHCDPVCFKGETAVELYGTDDDNIVWEDQGYDDEQAN
jgi:hypothetical protein